MPVGHTTRHASGYREENFASKRIAPMGFNPFKGLSRHARYARRYFFGVKKSCPKSCCANLFNKFNHLSIKSYNNSAIFIVNH